MEWARIEWALFQRSPPRMSDGSDIFSTVYRHVTQARGSALDLKRTAEGRFRSLVKKNEHLFLDHILFEGRDLYFVPRYTPPFFLVVDEVEAPVLQSPSSNRRPACSSRGVSALFYGFDQAT